MAELPAGPRAGARSTSPDDLRYGLATLADAAQCNDLNNTYFKRTRSLSQWLWEFQPPHLPFQEVPYAVARDGDKIVGTQGYIILPMLSQNGPFWAAKGEDAIVLPKYWNRDALGSLWATLKNFCREKNVPLVWGFNARKGSFSRVGLNYFEEPLAAEWYYSFNTRAMELVLERTAKMKERFAGPWGGAAKIAISEAASLWGSIRTTAARSVNAFAGNAPKGLSIVALEASPGEEFERLSRRFIAQFGGITIHRSPAFLKWRLQDNPFVTSTIVAARAQGELVGYIACSRDGERSHITDQFVCAPSGEATQNTAIFEALLAFVIARLRKQGAGVLYSQAFNAHPIDASYQRAMTRIGFLRRVQKVGACYLRIPDAAPPAPAAADNYESWFVTSVYNEGRQG